jgi:hypothetical protein
MLIKLLSAFLFITSAPKTVAHHKQEPHSAKCGYLLSLLNLVVEANKSAHFYYILLKPAGFKRFNS